MIPPIVRDCNMLLMHCNAVNGIISAYKSSRAIISSREHGQSLREIDMPSISRTPSIYQIRHIESGKVYVGSAANPQKRWQHHYQDLDKGTHHSQYLQRAWNKHSRDAFMFEIIEPVLFVEDLIAREQYWIDVLKAANHKYGFNTSPTAGSCLGIKRTDEERAKMSARSKAQFADPAARAKQSELAKAQFADPAQRALSVVAAKKRCADPLFRKGISERAKARYADPAARERAAEKTRAFYARKKGESDAK